MSDGFEALLDTRAPFTPVDLCPEVSVFQATNLHELKDALNDLVGAETGTPYWGLAWPAGAAMARIVLDDPSLVRG
ncbi:MAG: methyltransferase, partial [Planctomycetes bacterium]|nr:methyltransferase [Planctomycetota bacterium]